MGGNGCCRGCPGIGPFAGGSGAVGPGGGRFAPEDEMVAARVDTSASRLDSGEKRRANGVAVGPLIYKPATRNPQPATLYSFHPSRYSGLIRSSGTDDPNDPFAGLRSTRPSLSARL